MTEVLSESKSGSFKPAITTSWQYIPQEDFLFILRKTDNDFFYFTGDAVSAFFRAVGLDPDDPTESDLEYIRTLEQEGLLQHA